MTEANAKDYWESLHPTASRAPLSPRPRQPGDLMNYAVDSASRVHRLC
jgi:hypothetical protein